MNSKRHDGNFAVCTQCKAKLPVQDFNPHPHSPSGRCYSCRFCNAQKRRLKRKAKRPYSNHDDSILRSIQDHNKLILEDLLVSLPQTVFGFIPHTDQVFQINFRKDSKEAHTYTMLISYIDTGLVYRGFTYPVGYSKEEMVELLLDLLKKSEIRLERNKSDIDLVKQTIYFY